MGTAWQDFDNILKREEGWSLDRVQWRIQFLHFFSFYSPCQTAMRMTIFA